MDNKTKDIIRLYYENKRKAEKKDEPFLLTLETHISAWTLGNRWAKKTKGDLGLVLTKKDYSKPYSDDNYIIVPRYVSQRMAFQQSKSKKKMKKGSTHTEETKKKMSESHIGKKHSEEIKKKISEAMKGKKRGPYKRKEKKIANH